MFFLIIVIIPSFVAFYGWSDYSRTRGDGGQVAQPAVVKYGLLDKVEITHNDISNAENSLKGQYAQYARSHDIPVEEAVLGKLADPKDQLNQALNLEALRRYAKEHGITATSEEAVAALQARFTPEQREQYLDYLQRQGMSFERQVEELKAQLLLSKAVESINSQAVSYTHLTLPTNREV